MSLPVDMTPPSGNESREATAAEAAAREKRAKAVRLAALRKEKARVLAEIAENQRVMQPYTLCF